MTEKLVKMRAFLRCFFETGGEFRAKAPTASKALNLPKDQPESDAGSIMS